MVFIAAFLPFLGNFDKIKFGTPFLKIRMDHLLHFTVYFLICMYFLGGQKKNLLLFDSNPLWKFILLVLFLATVTEVVQWWVPERTFNIMDWVANVGGIVLGMGIIMMVQRCEGKTAGRRRRD